MRAPRLTSTLFVLSGALLFNAGCGDDATCPTCPTPMPAASCTFELSATGTGMRAAGGNVAVLVRTQQGCRWTFQGNDPWITVVPDADGTSAPGNGNGSVVVQVAPNPGQRRTGTASIAYQTLLVDQEGTNGSMCTFQVVPAFIQVPSVGGQGQFTVIPSSETCGWAVDQSATTEDWVSGFIVLHAVGTRTVPYSVKACSAPNRPSCPASGILSIRDSANQQGATVTFTQQ